MLRRLLLLVALMLAALPALAQTTTVVSVTFDRGVIGRFGNNTGQANGVINTPNLGITSITFSQVTDNGRFGGTQGNDYCGTLTLNGAGISFNACVNWRITANGAAQYIGFVPSATANLGTVNLPYSGPLANTTSYNLIVSTAYNNVNPENNFAFRTNASAPSYADGTNISGNAAASNALQSLNTYLDDTRDTTRPVITGPGAATVGGTGSDSISVAEGTTSVTTFTVNENVTWTLEGNQANLFSISKDNTTFSGALSFNPARSFDAQTPSNNVYTVNVVATDTSGNRSVMTFTVTVLDTTKPVITGPGAATVGGTGSDSISVAEGTTSVTTFTVNENVTWTLEGNQANLFSISKDNTTFSGALSFNPARSFDAQTPSNNVYTVNVVATDTSGNRSVMTFTVTVLDTTKPVITGPGTATVGGTGSDSISIAEGTTSVTTFTVSENVTWTLEGNQANLFSISKDNTTFSGALSFNPARSFDSETPANNVYVVNVVATDPAGNRSVMTFTVTVLDATKPVITGPGASTVDGVGEDGIEITEGTTSVTTFAVDEEVTWSLEGNDAGLFRIDLDGSDFGGKLSFLEPPAFDSQTPENNVYVIDVVATDGAGNRSVMAFTVTVLQLPDTTQPVITGPGASTVDGAGEDGIEITEGTTSVTTFAVDEEVTWSLEGNDAGLFRIDLDGSDFGGKLSFLEPPAFDAQTPENNVYVIDVVATDGAGNRSVMTFTVTVLQQADTTAPEFSGPGGTTVDGSGTGQTEVTEGTTSVATFSVSEAVEWTLEGDQAGLFRIEGNEAERIGMLSFDPARDYDHETPENNVYVVDVVATDRAGNRSVMTFTVILLARPQEALIQGPSDEPGATGSEQLVPEGTREVHRYTAVDRNGAPIEGRWSIRDLDVDMFTIDPDSGLLSFVDPPRYVPDGNNTYMVWVVFTYGEGLVAEQWVMAEVLRADAPRAMLDRDEIEEIILDVEVAKLRGQQDSLRSMTSAARDRLAAGGCGQASDQDGASAGNRDDACRVEDSDMSVSVSEKGASLVGHHKRILAFDGYRRITNLDLSILDQDDLRTLSFNGHFALENYRAENALYGIFAGVSLNTTDVARDSTGRARSYGVSVGAYAVHELRPELFSEVYLSVGRSQNQLELTDGDLEVAADYGTTEAHFGWILSGKIQKDNWDILPELGIQLSHSASSAIEVTGATPDELESVTWDGLTATLARANLSTEFRYYLDGRAEDAWVLNVKPGVVCERVSAVSVSSGCGISASIGLDHSSADGRQRFSADIGVEEIDDVQRRSAALNYELRF